MTGIISAMSIEIKCIEELLVDKVEKKISGISYTRGLLHGHEVVTAVCGVGKVFAAICAQTMILEYSPKFIINAGVAGSLVRSLKIGDIAIADSVVQHDMDTSAFGDPVGLISGINIINMPTNGRLTNLIKECTACLEIPSITGVIASGDQFLNNSEKKDYVAKQFEAIACEMEGASIGQVCYVNHVGFSVIRAISDEADHQSIPDYKVFLRTAAENSSKVISLLFSKYGSIFNG